MLKDWKIRDRKLELELKGEIWRKVMYKIGSCGTMVSMSEDL